MDDHSPIVNRSLQTATSDGQIDSTSNDADDKAGFSGKPGRRFLLRRFWKGAKGFWGKSGDRAAWWLSAGILAVILLNLGTSYGINVWNRGIFDALDKRDSSRVLTLALIYFPLLA